MLPGTEGDFGVLPRHERFLTALREARSRSATSAGTRKATISDGFADVSGERGRGDGHSCAFARRREALSVTPSRASP